MMAAQSSDFRVGEVVDYVPQAPRRLVLPTPDRWFIQRCQVGRDGKVIEACARHGVSAYSPVIVRYIDRRTGRPAARPHLGRKVVQRMLPGLIFVPDFETLHPALEHNRIDYLEGWLNVGPCLATLSVEEMQKLREIEEGETTQRQQLPRGMRFRRGDTVRIVDGPLALFAAQVEGLDSKGRLKVFVAALMRGVSVTIDQAQVEPAEGSR